MSYIIVTRNPSCKKLIAITDGDDTDVIAEYETASAAMKAAADVAVCEAWGYEVLEVDK